MLFRENSIIKKLKRSWGALFEIQVKFNQWKIDFFFIPVLKSLLLIKKKEEILQALKLLKIKKTINSLIHKAKPYSTPLPNSIILINFYKPTYFETFLTVIPSFMIPDPYISTRNSFSLIKSSHIFSS